MTDHGIVFHPSMIAALRADRKTQTRRMIKNQPELIPDAGTPRYHVFNRHGGMHGVLQEEIATTLLDYVPYAVGDRLWVREGLKRASTDQGVEYKVFAVDGTMLPYHVAEGWPWKPKALSSRYMPKWASRMTLHVTGVRAEPLQAITEADALAEGVMPNPHVHKYAGRFIVDTGGLSVPAGDTAAEAYGQLMDGLHGDGFWASNPWVNVLTFEVEDCNIEGARP